MKKIPPSWHETPVGELLAADDPGFWGEDASGDPATDISVLRSTNFDTDLRLDFAEVVVRSFPRTKRVSKRLAPGDLLLERSGGGPNTPVGRVVYFNRAGEFSYSNFIQRLRADTKKCLPQFLAYALHELHRQGKTLLYQQRTSGLRNLNYAEYLDHPILLPPPLEQAKIAAMLAAGDEAVESGRVVLAQVKTLRQALLHTLLTRGLPGGRTKLRTVRLGEIYAERNEHGIAGLPVMSVTNSGLIDRSTTDRRVESDLPDEGHALVRKDDIAYNMMRMWQGVSCLADRDCLVSPAYVVCSPKKGIVPQYGAYLLKAPHVVQLLRLHSQGVHEDRLRLYYKHFAPIKVEIPDEDTQCVSVRMVASLDARVAAAASHVASLERVKSALSTALLTGEVRVSVAAAREKVRA